MKKLLLIIALAITALQADVYVNGYTKSNGTYVKPHYRTNPDSSKSNNYSSGAYNPHKSSYGSRSNSRQNSSSGLNYGGAKHSGLNYGIGR